VPPRATKLRYPMAMPRDEYSRLRREVEDPLGANPVDRKAIAGISGELSLSVYAIRSGENNGGRSAPCGSMRRSTAASVSKARLPRFAELFSASPLSPREDG